MLTKEGYEQRLPGAMHGAQRTSYDNPAVLKLWNTNIPHQELVSGEKSSAIIPDGRRYRVDLTNGVIAEGEEGDLVVRIRCPTSVTPGERHAWSCELMAASGLLEENRDLDMWVAPESGYTNVSAYQQEAGVDGWSPGLYGKRFYLRLRGGQIYGRITLHLTASPSRYEPAGIRLEYAVNPSGSRLLR
jgi:hypothetical protein